jgi:hypothetical protein
LTAVRSHEEHGEVVRTWQALGYRGEHVVCFDRHLDLKPLSPQGHRLCASAGRDLGALNRPLPLREADGAYGLDDFWSVGPACGAVSRLTWIPSWVPHGQPGRERILAAVAYLPAPADVLDYTHFDGNRLRTRLCGLDVEVRGFADFAASPPRGFRIDVDLDWFAMPGCPDQIDPRSFGAELVSRGWAGQVDSLAFSVRSGFLKEEQRRIGAELLTALKRSDAKVTAAEEATAPAEALAALRANLPLDGFRLREVREAELTGLGPLGVVIEGLLRLNGRPSGKDTEAAEQAWLDASASGVGSTWLAYRIGLYHFARRSFERARLWLDRTHRSLADPLEGHALLTAALCSARLGNYDDAAKRAHWLSAFLPLNVRAGELAMTLDTLAGRPRDDNLADRLGRIRALVA